MRQCEVYIHDFSTQYSLTLELIHHSFLSERNKTIYWRSTDYRRKMLA